MTLWKAHKQTTLEQHHEDFFSFNLPFFQERGVWIWEHDLSIWDFQICDTSLRLLARGETVLHSHIYSASCSSPWARRAREKWLVTLWDSCHSVVSLSVICDTIIVEEQLLWNMLQLWVCLLWLGWSITYWVNNSLLMPRWGCLSSWLVMGNDSLKKSDRPFTMSKRCVIFDIFHLD